MVNMMKFELAYLHKHLKELLISDIKYLLENQDKDDLKLHFNNSLIEILKLKNIVLDLDDDKKKILCKLLSDIEELYNKILLVIDETSLYVEIKLKLLDLIFNYLLIDLDLDIEQNHLMKIYLILLYKN